MATKSVGPALRMRAERLVKLLRDEFPEPQCALLFETPFQLLVATILSAQCTDVRVNLVTPTLFAEAPDAASMVKLGLERIRHLIRSINFFNNKSAHILETSVLLVNNFNGDVPPILEDLIKLPGVGRKTANVVLGNAFGQPALVVDTHVRRLANRLELCRTEDVVQIEQELEKLLPPSDWIDFSHLLILHGRKTCKARAPLCQDCSLKKLCPSREQDSDSWRQRSRS